MNPKMRVLVVDDSAFYRKRITESLHRSPEIEVVGSAARIYPDRVLSIILTGMGAEGKQAARLLKEGGSTVCSQDESSCVVYGMPQAVEKAGSSDQVLALDDIGPMLGKLT